MIPATLIIAAHGSNTDSAASAIVERLASNIRAGQHFAQVSPAYRRGSPAFNKVLDVTSACDLALNDAFIVVPLMTSEGWFCTRVLPEMLAENGRFSEVRLVQTPPVGNHPDVAEIVGRQIRRAMARHFLRPDETTLLIVGHGTTRHDRSDKATLCLSEQMRSATSCHSNVSAFLDEPPFVEDIVAQIETRHLLVFPFLIGGGQHTISDIPRRIGLCSHASNVHVVYDCAFGENPELADLIVDRATIAWAEMTVGVRS